MSQTRTFPLADVLSVTTGRLLSRRHMDGLYELLGYMTGQSLFTHQLPDAADACGPALVQQHPFLDGLTPPDGMDAPDLLSWLADAERQHGDTVDVVSLTDWQHRDPIEDACDKIGADRVFVAPLPSREG